MIGWKARPSRRVRLLMYFDLALMLLIGAGLATGGTINHATFPTIFGSVVAGMSIAFGALCLPIPKGEKE